MSPGEVYSHKGKRLEQHLLETAELAQKIAEHFRLELEEGERRALVLHDLAKAHPLFQKHLLQQKGRFGHAAPSAALVLGLTGDLLCTEAVRRHHSSLENLDEAKKFWFCWDYQENACGVIGKIPVWNGAEAVMEALGHQLANWGELLPAQVDWDELIFERVEFFPPDEEKMEEAWLRLRMLYSLLVTADRYNAAVGRELEYHPLRIDQKRVEDFAASLRGRPLAEWRQQVREEVVRKAEEVLKKPGIYTLTLPTGAGKTLVGLELSMLAAERFAATGIIYVLPFISLVEQNADVARVLFKDVSPVREDHYLSEVAGEEGDPENPSPRERFLSFFRYWQEPVVITTMAKFWEVLYSPKGNDTMSLHRLSRAVVILDEPQAIPSYYWQGFGKTLSLFSEKLNTTFILMTATQPEIARGLELAPRAYFFPMIRHRFEWRRERTTVPELLGSPDIISKLQDKSALLVFNTHRSALLAYLELQSRGVTSYFLSGWVTPLDRRAILQQIREDENAGKPARLVSTQVVEAGVDLDFQFVYRDLGPLDSIIQVAGRCNRHGKREQGEVLVCELCDENGRSYAGYVYDSTLLVATKAVLKDSFDERDCPGMVAAYYRKVREITAENRLWEDISSGRWGEFHDLIEKEERGEATLVVAYEGVENDLDLLSRQAAPDEDVMRMVEQKREASRRLGLHAVSVPAKMLEEWLLRVGGMIYGAGSGDILRKVSPGIYLVQGEGIGRIYSRRTGFMPPDLEAAGDGVDDW